MSECKFFCGVSSLPFFPLSRMNVSIYLARNKLKSLVNSQPHGQRNIFPFHFGAYKQSFTQALMDRYCLFIRADI